MTPRLLERYREVVVPKLTEEFAFKNAHQVPAMTKIVVNMGLGEAAANPKLIENAASELALVQPFGFDDQLHELVRRYLAHPQTVKRVDQRLDLLGAAADGSDDAGICRL